MVIRQLTRGSLSFVVGLLAGFTVCLTLTTLIVLSRSSQSPLLQGRTAPGAGEFFSQQVRQPGADDLRDLSGHGVVLEGVHGGDAMAGGGNARVVSFDDLHAHHDDDSKAKEMAERVRVLVWVMTSPKNLDNKAVHVRNTWAKRANLVLFMSSRWNSTFPTIGLNVSEGREHLTAKTMQAFRYVYDHHFDDADWFMKADDDTYVIMENLRYLLSNYNPEDPIYFGQAFKVFVKQGYASGGAGYVISKEALRRLVTKGINNSTLCRGEGGAEDIEMGRCLMNLGVRLGPSVDRLGRTRFHCFGPLYHLQGVYVDWYKRYDANGAKGGIGNISDYAISFHYISPMKMYELEYFIYHLKPFGIVSKFQNLNLDSNNNQSQT